MTLREYAIDHLIQCGLPHDQAREVALQMESTNLSFNGRWDEDVASCPAGIVELLRQSSFGAVYRSTTPRLPLRGMVVASDGPRFTTGSVVFF